MPDIGVTAWTGPRRELWHRIDAHDFESAIDLNFTRRLARDKNWTLDFTRRAIAEYRKFCFLAVACPEPATPSEEVDEVWHQHLTYTRDYWDVWCGRVLRAKLHHDPTLGGPDEQRRFRGQYAATLARYEDFFGPSPQIYWPATHLRFGSCPRYQTFDTRRHLLLRNPMSLLK